ncbi:peptidyl-tRNA hydrolase [Paracoccus halophilus]|uniref:Peptidyl-tRNA hydrolase n=1 Tax=Paracoccus halophilus TaxID=376733 RepID=A0A099F1L3_9RHOB|nr:aminoacyl-tRNA hydrolase [Paracoccus halophilus]KGJ04141.1 peptidyl-tRNA hydrolase [Paracoccus halophilus]SFA55794.1 peptidyl-tRNA hydrolase [Paracoccus halophilus]
MILIVGLGNPGMKYAQNRHNIGFMAADRIAGDHGFGPWRSRFQGEFAEGRLADRRVALLKPATFMNLSGQSVGEAMRYLKLEPADVIVLHDELDLASGKVRLKTGGGHAGHNGLRSIHQHIGEAYRRLRIGIGHPGHKDRVAAYVLSDFAKAEQEGLEDLLRGISEGAAMLAAGDDGRFMNAVAARVAPARNSSDNPPAAGTGPAPAAGRAAIADPPQPPEAPASFTDRLRALSEKFR